MRGKRNDLPSSHEGMKTHLMDALQRIKEGKPNNIELAELAKRGKLKATPTTVAKEAGVSRTLIAYEECRYPSVRAAIKGQADAPVRAKTDMRSINSDLREVNRILEHRFKLALSAQAAMLNRMQKLEGEYNDKAAEVQRISARKLRNPNEIAGLRILNNQEQK